MKTVERSYLHQLSFFFLISGILRSLSLTGRTRRQLQNVPTFKPHAAAHHHHMCWLATCPRVLFPDRLNMCRRWTTGIQARGTTRNRVSVAAAADRTPNMDHLSRQFARTNSDRTEKRCEPLLREKMRLNSNREKLNDFIQVNIDLTDFLHVIFRGTHT
jgi:hypothetical protein